MGLDEQSNIWKEQSESLKRADELSQIPEEELTPEMKKELDFAQLQRELSPEARPEAKRRVKRYNTEQIAIMANHIMKHFGDFDMVMQEKDSPYLHLDIGILEPTEEKPYYTLVTMGMGSHRMKVPGSETGISSPRVELVISLPGEWRVSDFSRPGGRWNWTVQIVTNLARLPILWKTWIGVGQVVNFGTPFATDTELSGVILAPALPGGDERKCRVPNLGLVDFYRVILLYPDEMKFAGSHGWPETLEMIEKIGPVLRPDRPDALPL